MIPELNDKTKIFRILHRIDINLAEQIQQERCPYCNGPLHHSDYDRKPRGGPINIPDEYLIRQSLCCGICRRRTMPPSCLFMGRHVYWHVVILIVMALRQNRPKGKSAVELMDMFGMTRNTYFRWIAFFRDEFPSSNQWQSIRGKVNSTIQNDNLPSALILHFIEQSDSPENGIIACIYFITTGQGLPSCAQEANHVK